MGRDVGTVTGDMFYQLLQIWIAAASTSRTPASGQQAEALQRDASSRKGEGGSSFNMLLACNSKDRKAQLQVKSIQKVAGGV
jgi:hypothetical protein